VIHAVDHRRLERPPLQSAKARACEVSTKWFPMLVAVLAEFKESLAYRSDVRFVVRDRLAEGDRHRIRQPARHLEKVLTALERKDAPPELIEPDRHDRALRSARDQFVAAFQAKKHAATRQLAFRKDADDFTLADALARSLHCVLRAPLAKSGPHRGSAGPDRAALVCKLPHPTTKRIGRGHANCSTIASTHVKWFGRRRNPPSGMRSVKCGETR
jgi:hypothetical protein